MINYKVIGAIVVLTGALAIGSYFTYEIRQINKGVKTTMERIERIDGALEDRVRKQWAGRIVDSLLTTGNPSDVTEAKGVVRDWNEKYATWFAYLDSTAHESYKK